MAVGSEAMGSSLTVYDYVKTSAKKTPGLKTLAEQLGERFEAIKTKFPKAADSQASDRLVDEYQYLVNELLTLVYEDQNLVNESLHLVNEYQNFVNQSLGLLHKYQNLINESLVLVNKDRNVVGQLLTLMREYENLVKESLDTCPRASESRR